MVVVFLQCVVGVGVVVVVVEKLDVLIVYVHFRKNENLHSILAPHYNYTRDCVPFLVFVIRTRVHCTA